MWVSALGLALALAAAPGVAQADGLYKVCYGDMAVSLLMDVSAGATLPAAEGFAAVWMAENAGRLDAGFSKVTAAMLDDLNIDRARHGEAYGRALGRWRDCLRRVYEGD